MLEPRRSTRDVLIRRTMCVQFTCECMCRTLGLLIRNRLLSQAQHRTDELRADLMRRLAAHEAVLQWRVVRPLIFDLIPRLGWTRFHREPA